MGKWWHAHVHSNNSCLDAVSPVSDLVANAVKFNQPALALTDHGVMSGVVELYKGAKANGLAPFPGLEGYLVSDVTVKDAERYHVTLLARNYDGYKALVKLSSKSHTRPSYHKKPRFDFADLAAMSEAGETDGLILMTGCYFGLLQQSLARSGDMKRAKSVLNTYKQWFPHTYVEIQHHSIDRQPEACDPLVAGDDKMVDALYSLAEETSTPVFVTHDSHYVEAKDKVAHDMMKKLIIRNAEPTEAGFPGDTYHFATTAWVKRHYRNHQKVWNAALASAEEVLELNELTIPVLDQYRFYVPKVGKSPDRTLRKLCEEELADRKLGAEYQERLDEELSIIKSRGFAGYLLHVYDYTAWAKGEGFLVRARGSAASSVAVWLLGITDVDPLKWGLLFERFISEDRERPPDIDTDVSDIAREPLIEYLKQTFDVVQIGTYSALGVREDDGRGALIGMYMSFVKQHHPDATIKTLDDARAHSETDYRALWHLDKLGPNKSVGSHAAGFVVSTREHKLRELVPMMLIPSSERTVTQFTMNDVEDMGFIKDDVLGLRNLTTAQRCQEIMGVIDPLDFTWIPFDDPETMKLLRSGKTDGVFQFEGWSNAKVAREMKVRKTEDCVVATSLGRPAVLEAGYTDEYIARKNARGKGVTYPGPIFKRHLQDTYGIIVFQEQVLSILIDLGMSVTERNKLLKAIKASNKNTGGAAKVFEDARQSFYDHAASAGMAESDVDDGWAMVEGFASYGFNKAHAVSYGVFGYWTAYLKVHHPLEYMSALLETTAGMGDKERKYVAEARRLGLRLLGASVNDSGVVWSIDRTRNAIRKGLLSIKGVGRGAAEELVDNAPYTDLADLIARTNGRKVTGGKDTDNLNGVLAKLQAAGALQCIGLGRSGW